MGRLGARETSDLAEVQPLRGTRCAHGSHDHDTAQATVKITGHGHGSRARSCLHSLNMSASFASCPVQDIYEYVLFNFSKIQCLRYLDTGVLVLVISEQARTRAAAVSISPPPTIPVPLQVFDPAGHIWYLASSTPVLPTGISTVAGKAW